jgi:hypothetical protein
MADTITESRRRAALQAAQDNWNERIWGQQREYVACVVPQRGGTESVTITANSWQAAVEALLRLGYYSVRSIT